MHDGSVSGQRYVAGIAGVKGSTDSVTNCRNESEDTATVTGTYTSSTTSNYAMIAGVLGQNAGGAITDCYNNANVSGTGQYTHTVAGIVGYNAGTSPITKAIYLVNFII